MVLQTIVKGERVTAERRRADVGATVEDVLYESVNPERLPDPPE